MVPGELRTSIDCLAVFPTVSLTLTSCASLKAGPDMAGLSLHILSVLAGLPRVVALHSSLAFYSVVEVGGSHGPGQEY